MSTATPEYKILQDWNHIRLSKEVTDYMEGGWSLHGPLQISDLGADTRYTQVVFFVPAKPARTRAKKSESA
ncbi:hypothetical protein D3C87_963290 [compost metagenome]